MRGCALNAVMRTLRHVRSNRTSALKLAARLAIGGYAGLSGLNAQAADLSSVAAAFGNTVVSSYPDGTSQKIWLHPDGSWNGISRRGVALSGQWTLRGDKVCLRQSRPPTLPISYCTPLPANGGPGVQWTGRDVAGRPIRLSLMKGMPATPQTGASGETQAR